MFQAITYHVGHLVPESQRCERVVPDRIDKDDLGIVDAFAKLKLSAPVIATPSRACQHLAVEAYPIRSQHEIAVSPARMS